MYCKSKKLTKYLLSSLAMLAMLLMLFGCSGSDGAAGAKGDTGPTGTVNPSDVEAAAISAVELAAIQPESCAICHSGYGYSKHQAVYNKYTDTTLWTVTIDSVSSVAGTTAGTYDTTLTFTLKYDGQPYVDVDGLPTLSSSSPIYNQATFYMVQYDSATRKFINSKSFSRTNVKATATAGQYTVKTTGAAFAPETSNAVVYMYVAKDQLTFESGGSYRLYDNTINVAKAYGDVGTYVSAANVEGCQKCHGTPYMKHGYRAAKVSGLPDFAACKNCHYDTRTGGHTGWQLLVDDPAAYAAQNGTPTDAQKTKYAYTANIMNDVHMSHAMEFAYPQSMANCVQCHEGKLTDKTVTDANFTLTTCKSCHPQTGPAEGTDAKRAPALAEIIPHNWSDATVCATCHTSGPTGIAPTFSTIHTGYDKKIYAAADKKYADIFTVSIDTISYSGTDLTIKFKATKTDPTSATTLSVTSITPMVLVGLYGYDTKDFIVDAHGRTIDTARNLEYVVGATHPRFTTVSAANGSWEVKASLASWASMITAGTVKRLEVGIIPTLKDADGTVVALNAPSKTFDLTTKAVVSYFSPIVKVADGCNNCHGALGVTFHNADRGGNVTVCRLCHTVRSGGSHLEMQSRSIDSYIHAIHSFQPFDIGDVNFDDPVEALRYEHHIESTYPNFTITNCESCHNSGTYNVPDQTKSLGGTFSASDTVAGRAISGVPSYVAGPASRACGSCHRAEKINEDAAGDLASFNQHTKTFGYLTEATSTSVFDTVITKIMNILK